MFAKIFAFFALVAIAFAAPSPKPAPAPAPQFLPYATSLDYVYPTGAVLSSLASPYSAGPVPVAYSALPGGAVYLR